MQTSLNIFKISFSVLFLVMSLVFVGCGREENHDRIGKEEKEHSETETCKEDDGHGSEHEAGESGASFAEGKGLKLTPETVEAMGLKTAEVAEHSFERQITTTAQVYRTARETVRSASFERPGYAYASAFLDPSQATFLQERQKVEVILHQSKFDAQLAKIDRAMEAFNKQIELLIEIKDSGNNLAQGTFIQAVLRGQSKKTVAIPHSAILKTATGTFVYVVNGDYLFRTPVEIGMEGENLMEIKEGLYEGDVIVEEPVQKLWLIELRFTKGSGHSH